MLYDPYGRIIEKPPKSPVTEILGAVQVRDQWSSYPSVKLAPEKLAGIFREADAGDTLRQAELFEEMEEKDPDLQSLFQTRKLAVQGLDFEVQPASDSAEDKKIAEHVRANLDDIDLEDAVLDLLDAIAKGCAFLEINWEMNHSAGAAWISRLEWIHQKRFTFMELSADWRAPLPKMPRLLTDEEPTRGIDVPSFKVVYHRYKGRSGFAQRAGLLRTVGYYYLFKNYDIKDWVIFIEKFGQPLRIGKFTAGASEDDKRILKEAIQGLGADAGAMISDQTMLEVLDAKTQQASSDLYARAAEFFNKGYAKAILGQTATTEGTPGALGGEQARSDVRLDLVKADAKALAKTIRSQIVWPIVGFNFGWEKLLPKIRFIVDEPEDLHALSSTHKNLVEMGAPIPVSFIQKKYGIPAPEGDEPLLTPPQPFAPSPFGSNLSSKKKALVPVKAGISIPVGDRMIHHRDAEDTEN